MKVTTVFSILSVALAATAIPTDGKGSGKGGKGSGSGSNSGNQCSTGTIYCRQQGGSLLPIALLGGGCSGTTFCCMPTTSGGASGSLINVPVNLSCNQITLLGL